jgi:autotransporter-associated beta strand protein
MYHINISASDWEPNTNVAIYLHGPLNTLGVQPTDRLLGVVYTDGTGSVQPGSFVVVPFYDAPIPSTEILRPGNYQLYTPDRNPNVPAHYSDRFNIGPRTAPFVAPDRYGNLATNNWGHSRGGRDGWNRDESPELTDPEWPSVWSEQPVALYATVTPTFAAQAISDPPNNQPSFISLADWPASHFGHDMNVDLVPDADYAWVLADANFFTEVDNPGKSNEGRIECEWETLNNGFPFYGSYGHGTNGFPVWAMATPGDRVYMVGRWVLDNGHPGTGDRTEIHPPRLMATMRKRNIVIPFNGGSNNVTRASQVDIYVSGNGGGCNKFPDGLSTALNNNGAGGGRIEDVLSPQDLYTYFAWGPYGEQTGLGDGDREAFDAKLFYEQHFDGAPDGSIKWDAGPSAFGWTNGPECRRIDDMDYDFDVPLPVAPAGATTPLVRVLDHIEHTAVTDEMITYTNFDANTGLPTMAHVHLPFKGVENGIYARTLKFYWNTYSAPGYHFVVDLLGVDMPLGFGSPLYMWADVCGHWVSLTDLDPADFLTPTQIGGNPGNASFPLGTVEFDVYLDTNDTMRVLVFGYAQHAYDHLFGWDVGLPAYLAGKHIVEADAGALGSGENEGLGGALFDSPIATPSQFAGVQGPQFIYPQNNPADPVFRAYINVTYIPDGLSPPVSPRYWIGDSGAWSNPGNWSPNGVPQTGEDLIFTNSPGYNVTNDLPGLSVRSLQFTHTGSLWGEGLTVTTGINSVGVDNGVLGMYFSFLRLGGELVISQDVGSSWTFKIFSPVDLNGHDLTCGSIHGGSVLFQNNIYGTGTLTFTEGDNYLSNSNAIANSFTGRVTVNGGTLWLNSATGPAFPNDLLIQHGGTVSVIRDSQTPTTSTVQIFSGGNFVVNGLTGIKKLVLNNIFNDTIPCAVDSSGGRLDILESIASYNDSSLTNPIIMGNVGLNGVIPIWTYGSALNEELGVPALDIPAALSGQGFVKRGNATMSISGGNWFSGWVQVDESVLDVKSGQALGPGPLYATPEVLLTGSGSLSLRDSILYGTALLVEGSQQITTETAGSSLIINAGVPVTWSGPIQLETNLVISGGGIILSGAITNTGGLDFRNTGTSLITGNNDNSYTGITRVRCPLLEFNKPFGARAFAGPLVVGGGGGPTCEARWLSSYQHVYTSATLFSDGFINLNNKDDDFWDVTFNGGTVDSGPIGHFVIYQPLTVNASSSSAVINGQLGLPSGGTTPPSLPAVFNVADGSADCDLIVNALIYGTPQSFVKQGAGTMCLTASNIFDAVTLVEGGTLAINNSFSLAGEPGLVIYSNATLRASGLANLPGGFRVGGAGPAGTNGAVEVTPGSSLGFSGSVLLDSATTFNVGSGSTLSLGSLSGQGPVTKTGSGDLYFLGSPNTYSGDTVVLAGQLLLETFGGIAVPNNLVIGPGPAGSPATVLFLHGSAMGGNTVTVNANSVLNLNGNSLSVSQLNLNDGGSALTGSGTLAFNFGGQVNVGSQNPSGSLHGASIWGNIQIAPNDSVTFTVAPFFVSPVDSTPELDVPATVSPSPSENPGIAPGFIVKEGQGQMRVGANNTYRGLTTINNGTLIASSPTALGIGNATVVNNGASLALDGGGLNINNEPLYLSSSNSAALDCRSGSNTWSGTIALSQPSGINVNPANGYLQALNTVSGTGGLTKSGAGRLQFWGFGPNTWSGGTTVAGGTLEAGRVSQVSIPGDVVVGDDSTTNAVATLQIDREQQFSPGANVTVHKSGSLQLNSDPNLGVPVPVIGTLSGGGNAFFGPTNASLTVSNSAFCAFNGVISGAGTFRKQGAATMQLTGINSFSGPTVINTGTLQVDGSQAQSSFSVGTGTTLQGSGVVGPITGTGTVSPGSGPGILTCGNLSIDNFGTLRIELNGASPGSGYDQLNVRGTVILSAGARHTILNSTLSFHSWLSNTFTILKNDGTDAVSGTFSGLSEGSTLTIGSEQFKISYVGGDGNDVVLTQITGHPLERLALQSSGAGSVRVVWPTNDPLYTLQSNTNLNTTNWIAVSPPPVVLGTNYVFTNATTGAGKFYRLVK